MQTIIIIIIIIIKEIHIAPFHHAQKVLNITSLVEVISNLLVR